MANNVILETDKGYALGLIAPSSAKLGNACMVCRLCGFFMITLALSALSI